jgi:hypothetical protein
MAQDTMLEWNVVETPPVKKSVDWFWAVGIIILSLAVIAIVFGNPLFGVFLVVVLFVLFVLTHKHPRTIHYILTKDGIFEGERLYLFSNLKSFYVDETTYHVPTLLVEVKRWFLPIVSIPLPQEIAPQDIRMYMRPYLMERELKEPLFHHLFEMFGL